MENMPVASVQREENLPWTMSATLIFQHERQRSQHRDAAKLPHRLQAAIHSSLPMNHSGNLEVSSGRGHGVHHHTEAVQPGIPRMAISVHLLYIIHLVTSLESVHHPRMSHTEQDPKKEIHQHMIEPTQVETDGQASGMVAALRTAMNRMATLDLRRPRG